MKTTLTGNQLIGYDLASGAFHYIGNVIIVAVILCAIGWGIRSLFAVGMDDTDRSRWDRSGLEVLTDAKTGVEYLSDGHGGLVRREGIK